MKILVIDDNLPERIRLQDILEEEMPAGDTILAVENGEQGLIVLKEHAVDLVIVDLLLPGMSGIDVLVQSKALNPVAEVILITCSPSIEAAVVAMKKGARDYLLKPINATLLKEKILTVRQLHAVSTDAKDLCESTLTAIRAIINHSPSSCDSILKIKNVIHRFLVETGND